MAELNPCDDLGEAVIRLMPNRVKSCPFDVDLSEARNLAEKFFNKLKNFGAVATRYDKRADNCPASVQLASIRIRLRSCESVA
ncbi:hypothetical protein [Sedimentitalea xiamensis]|uniref:hypothetical protein n=1 Tax=Sedimentitalea xiamensis TaxID=3050037 RepID=UPI003899EE26